MPPVALSPTGHFAGACAKRPFECCVFWKKTSEFHGFRLVASISVLNDFMFVLDDASTKLTPTLTSRVCFRWRCLFAYPLLFVLFCLVCKFLCVVVVHYAACSLPIFFLLCTFECVWGVYIRNQNLLAHISGSRPCCSWPALVFFFFISLKHSLSF